MSQLIIGKLKINDSLDWYAIVANTEIRYKFKGDGLEAQQSSVKILSSAMSEGQSVVESTIDTVLELDENATVEEVIQELFISTSEVFLEDILAYSAAAIGVGSLWDVIVEAGAALLALLE